MSQEDIVEQFSTFSNWLKISLAVQAKDQQAKAKAYLKMLTFKDMVLVMHLMLDILSESKKASMPFQERNATAADIHTQLQMCAESKKKYEVSDGPYLSKVNSTDLSEKDGIQLVQQGRENFRPTCQSVLLKLQKSMAQRLDDSQSVVINATQIVNFGMWSTEPEEDFGDSWVKLLAKHFEEPLKNAGD